MSTTISKAGNHGGKGRVSAMVYFQNRPRHAQRAVLVPLSGKVKPDHDDIEILRSDREALDGIVQAIMLNSRLAGLIARTWMAENGYLFMPSEGYELVKRVG